MKNPFKLQYLSDYRTELMGWSIIWIMMLHFTFNQIFPLGFIAQYGYAGVDIFMFVSGFGLFFSLEKDSKLVHFYQKRLLRIFPTYYILGIFGSVFLFHDNLWQYIFRYSTIGFWTNSIYAEWYIPSIVALYLIAPFIKKLFDKHLLFEIITINVIFLFASYYIVAGEYVEKGEAHFFLLYRIPAFIFGMYCGYGLKNNVSSTFYTILLLIGIPLFLFFYRHHHEVYNYKYFSTLFLLPLFILLFIFLSKAFSWLNPVISKIGNASLEIYIIQGFFFHSILTGLVIIPTNWHDLISICLTVLSSILGIFAHWIINRSGINKLL